MHSDLSSSARTQSSKRLCAIYFLSHHQQSDTLTHTEAGVHRIFRQLLLIFLVILYLNHEFHFFHTFYVITFPVLSFI